MSYQRALVPDRSRVIYDPGQEPRAERSPHEDRGQGPQPPGDRGAPRLRRAAVREGRQAGQRPGRPGSRALLRAPRRAGRPGGGGDTAPQGRDPARPEQVARDQALDQPHLGRARTAGQAPPRQAPQAPRVARRRHAGGGPDRRGRRGRSGHAARDLKGAERRLGRPCNRPAERAAGHLPAATLEGMSILDRALRMGEAKQFKRYARRVDAIGAWEPELELLEDDELRAQADRLRERARGGEPLDDLIPETFALVREVS